MPRPDADQPLIPSILDRMIDQEPNVSQESAVGRASGLAELKEAVKRDLEWLLNSRRLLADLPADLGHLKKSLLMYGLPDHSSSSLSNPNDQKVLRRAVEEAVERFESRLTNVAVTLVRGESSSVPCGSGSTPCSTSSPSPSR